MLASAATENFQALASTVDTNEDLLKVIASDSKHIYIYILYRIFKISLLNLEEIPSLINGQAQKALRAASDQRGEESSELSSDQVKKKPAGRGGLKRPSSSRGGRGRGRGRGRNPAKPVPDLLKRPASASSSKPPKKTKTSEDYWILFVFFNIIKIDHRS